MNNLFVPYEIAYALKEIGYEESGMAEYTDWGKTFNHDSRFRYDNESSDEDSKACVAPTYNDVIDWFRDKHKLILWIGPEGEYGNLFWRMFFMDLTRKARQYQETMGEGYFNHYENDMGTEKDYYTALQKAIVWGIAFVKSKAE